LYFAIRGEVIGRQLKTDADFEAVANFIKFLKGE
jgi:hypothetical protein